MYIKEKTPKIPYKSNKIIPISFTEIREGGRTVGFLPIVFYMVLKRLPEPVAGLFFPDISRHLEKRLRQTDCSGVLGNAKIKFGRIMVLSDFE